jgi:hypothetical protein
MADITTSTLGDLLKRLYAPWEIEQLVNLTYPVLNKCFAEGNAPLGGAGFYFPVRTKGARGHAYISEDQALPSGRQSTVKTAVVTPTVHAGVVQLTGLSMAVSSQDAMAFAEAFDENVQQTIEGMSAYKEGAGFRDGSGLLTTFNGDPAADVGPHTLTDVGFLSEGMYVDIIDVADNTRHATGVEVAEVDWVNKQVTWGSALAAAVDTGDEIYITESQDASGAPEDKEPIGLEGSLLATGSYLGIDRDSVSNWASNVYDASGFFDENIIMRARTRLTQESGIPLSGMRSMHWVCHPMQLDILFKLAIPRINYTGGSTFDLGYADGAVKFGGNSFETSYQCKPSVAYFGDWRYSKSFYTPNGKLHVDTQFNGSALKWVATRDVGLVFVKEYCAFAVTRPNAFVRVHTLTEASR